MRIPIVSLMLIAGISVMRAQDARTSPRSSLKPYVEYANTSSHLILGQSQNRRFAAAGVEYSYRILRRSGVAWNYVLDLRPVMLVQDPVSTTTQTIQFANQPPFGPFTLQQGPIQANCQSATFNDSNNGQDGVAVVDTRVCGTRWTYAGGFSPLGQEIAFFPKHRIQPLLVGNAGLVVATRDIPTDNSSPINFTFEFGAGLTIMRSPSRGFAIDYRIRHLSNGYLGYNNPGIDNQILRASYIFSRR